MTAIPLVRIEAHPPGHLSHMVTKDFAMYFMPQRGAMISLRGFSESFRVVDTGWIEGVGPWVSFYTSAEVVAQLKEKGWK